MAGNVRRIILFSLVGIFVLALGVWWYSGFSLGFMKFFAAGADTAQPDVVLDVADCTAAAGWSFDPDYNGAATIHIYHDGPPGTGTFVGSTTTSGPRSDIQAYAQQYYTGQPDRTNSGWSWTIPASLKDGSPHTLYAYAIDVDSNGATGSLGNPQANHSNVVPATSTGWGPATKVITCTSTGTAPPTSSVTCTPSTQNVAVGAQAKLAVSGGSAPYTWFAPEGTSPSGTGTNFAVSYSSPGTKKVTLQSTNSNGGIDNVACTVVVQ